MASTRMKIPSTRNSLALSVFLACLLITGAACRHALRRTNFLYGFCGERIKTPLTEVVGRVVSKWPSEDGDLIINLEPEAGFRRLLYEVKWSYEAGNPRYLPFRDCCLHLEIEPCEREKLEGFWNQVKGGDRIWVKGVWIQDPHGHGWMEIHPVMEGRIIPEDSTETFPPFEYPGLKPAKE